MEIENIALSNLIPYINNAKEHSDSQVKAVAASISEFGFVNPVLIGENNTIIAGHCRVLAAEKLNLNEIPCIRLSHLNEAQRKAYIIADNRLSEVGTSWNLELLRLEAENLLNLEFDTSILEIKDLLSSSSEKKEGNEEEESEAKEIDVEEYTFDCKCPRCGFEFNNE